MLYTRPCMQSTWKAWAAVGLSAGLLELPFPLAGPLPPWRSVFAWFGLVPLLWAILSVDSVSQPASERRPLRRGFLLAYVCGVLWYMGNCYWIYDTMLIHGGLPPAVSFLLLLAFSLVLGLYFGLFGLGLALVQRAGSVRLALAFAPFLWTALELGAARITSVPWDQLGYSQVDNPAMTWLAPLAGVYGISFVLVLMNSLCAGALIERERRTWFGLSIFGVGLAMMLGNKLESIWDVMNTPTPATAVLIQPNLDVGDASTWPGAEWDQHMAEFARLGAEDCKTYIKGIPQTGAPMGEIICPPHPTYPDLIVWPESPAPFFEGDPRFQHAMASLAQADHAPLIVNGIGSNYVPSEGGLARSRLRHGLRRRRNRGGPLRQNSSRPLWRIHSLSALLLLRAQAHRQGGRLHSRNRSQVFLLQTSNGQWHRYGVFICYEAVFADEVRQFARHGAEVFVNICDDGWYGDTSAPWQHLNMARMRAIENRRWILRDTNYGVTAAIDPYGRVRQSIPRRQAGELAAEFGFRNDLTFYTVHGDVFAWLCAVLSLGMMAWAGGRDWGCENHLHYEARRSSPHAKEAVGGQKPLSGGSRSLQAPERGIQSKWLQPRAFPVYCSNAIGASGNPHLSGDCGDGAAPQSLSGHGYCGVAGANHSRLSQSGKIPPARMCRSRKNILSAPPP